MESPRSPLTVLFLALSAGVCADRSLIVTLAHWSVLGVLALIGSWQAHRRCARATTWLLLAAAAMGGGWHHIVWHLYAANDLCHYASTTAQPCHLRVIAKSDLVELPHRAHGQRRFRLNATCYSYHGASWQRLSGRLEIELIADQSPVIGYGDFIEVAGTLLGVQQATNPGQFDFYAHRRLHRNLAKVVAHGQTAIRILQRGAWSLGRGIHQLRRQGHEALHSGWFSERRAQLLEAMLLGRRAAVPSSALTPFLTSGTIHLFSVSGLHVGVLATALWTCCVVFNLRTSRGGLLVALVVILFAAICETRAPVVRATVLVLTLCGARIAGRAALSLNSLAAAGLVVLLWNPCLLFQTGTQLSFLAVISLGWIGRALSYTGPVDPLQRLVWQTRPWLWRVARFLGWWLVCGWLASLVVWLVTLPLVANEFHIVSFVAPWLQPFLWLPLMGVMIGGMTVLLLSAASPLLAGIPAWMVNESFGCLEWLVALGNATPGSHIWTAGFDRYWTAAAYLIVLPTAWWLASRRHRRCLALLVVITIGSAFVPKWIPTARNRLTCAILDVGHGLAIVLHLPNGEVVLYDCGSLGNRRRAANVVQQYLWHRGSSTIDLLVLSHGDSDHYNAVPHLLSRTATRRCVATRRMQSQPVLRELFDSLRASGTSIEEPDVGGSESHGRVRLEWLHPQANFSADTDNAHSIVVRIRFGTQSLLLPGDLEGRGLTSLISTPSRATTVLASPHHGAAASNPPAFIRWCRPQTIVVSSKQSKRIEQLFWQVGRMCDKIYVTGLHGAVIITMTPTETTTRPWRTANY